MEPPPADRDWPEQMRRLLEWVEASGFVFEPWQIASYVTALRTKPFVILAGISGTGKTRLPQLVARACGQRCEVIPVRPDWTDSSDLLGYTDLAGTFRPGPLLELARQAQEDPQRSYVVVLDEMNLARVEHYFAEVLSRIEDRRLERGQWVSKPLLGAAQVLRERDDEETEARVWAQVGLPPNLALVGPVNMDESTHGFSRKVLDRAFTLELAESRLAKWGAPASGPGATLNWPASVLVPRKDSLAQASGLDAHQRQQVERVIETLERLNVALRQAHLQVGYRVRDEGALFVLHAADVRDAWVTSEGTPVDPLDLAISMKVLPRIVGGTGAIRRVLQGLLAWASGSRDAEDEEATEALVRRWAEAGRPSSLANAPFPRCAARLCLMWERMMDDGFTSYWL
ncbi:MAG: AAA domain-containing protein [Firmicutes bacterium]|nr:AAA domain-containing protein [Bacillota bacterium]